MKPAIVADEMFPEGAGPYMDIEEVMLIDNVCSTRFLGDFCATQSFFKYTVSPPISSALSIYLSSDTESINF